MHIGLFTDTYPPFVNGVSTSCYNLAQTLKAHGHKVTIVTARSDNGKLEFVGDIIYMPGLELKKLYSYRATKIFDRKVFNVIKDLKFDLIHNQTDATIGIFARRCAKKLHIPIVYTYHTSYEDYTYYVTHGVLDRIAKKVIRSYSKAIAKGSTEFITPSDKTKEFMRNVGNDVYVNVIPTGIDFSLFDPGKLDLEKVKEFKLAHGIDEETKTVLILGRIAKEKNMDVSVRYLASYFKKHPEQKIKVIVVGDGPARNELELLTHELDVASYFDFIGFVKASEVSFYYGLSDVYTSASITETQGLTFMEAMAGRDIVIARFDDNLSDTIIDGTTGFFFTDEYSFINKLERIFSLTDEEISQIKANALTTVDKYSIEKFYTNILEVYNRALKKYW